MSEHALLSASSAHRWLSCTPSVRLEETLPEESSVYADEGSLAHQIAELKLRKHFTEPMGTRTFNSKMKKLQENPLYQDEMQKHTDTYKDYLSSIVHGFAFPPYIAIEKRLDYSTYAPDGFGTGDAVVIGGNTLHVVDFKYGQGVPVSAEDNPQMKLYALGAYLYSLLTFSIKTVKLAIVQPRRDSLSEFELSIEELLSWGESIKPIAQKAFAGEGDFIAGEHCKFCRAKAKCRGRAEQNLVLANYKMVKPPTISNEEVGAILSQAQDLAAWAEALEKYALAECLKGNEIPGWKAIHGRSTRSFTSSDQAFKVLIANGTPETMLYERKPLTLTAVEDLLGKNKFKELLSEHVITPPGKPALAPESDKREAIKRSSAAEDFSSPLSENN